MIDVGRLERDRDYWDECDPTGGEATRYVEDKILFPWRKDDGPSYFRNGTWATYFPSPSLRNIPRPSRKQWSGPEDGLPPIGTECEVYGMVYGSSGDMKWKKVTVHAHVDGRALAESTHQSGAYVLYTQDECRPLKSEKERAVEAACKVCDEMSGVNINIDCSYAIRMTIERLYDAGALKMPEEGQ